MFGQMSPVMDVTNIQWSVYGITVTHVEIMIYAKDVNEEVMNTILLFVDHHLH